MIYIRVEMWPLGDPERRSVLGEGTISKVRGSTPAKGNYHVRISKKGGFKGAATNTLDSEQFRVCRPSEGSVLRDGTVEGFPRKRLLAWDLLFRALRNVIGERNKD